MSYPWKHWFGKTFGVTLALLVLFAGLGLPVCQAGEATWPIGRERANGQNRSRADYVQRIVELTNQERARHGLGPVTIDAALNSSAQATSQDMADHNFFSHTGSDGSEAGQRMARAGYGPLYAYGENIAAGQPSPEEVFAAWMNSEGHRSNILCPYFQNIGVGYAHRDGSTYVHYWTQHFAARGPNPPAAAAPQPPPEPTAVPAPSTATPVPPTATPAPPTPTPEPPTPTPVPPTPTPTPPPQPTPGAAGSASVRQVIELLNRERARRGLRALSFDAGLCLAAQRQSDDMALHGFFGHAGSDGSSVEDRIAEAAGPVSACTEAIAVGGLDPAGVVDVWLSNASSREQILSTRYTAVGAGCTFGPGSVPSHYWTVTLAVPQTSKRAAADVSSRSARPLPQWGTSLDSLLRLPLFGLGRVD